MVRSSTWQYPTAESPLLLNISRNLGLALHLWEGSRQKSSRARWLERSEQELKNNSETGDFSGASVLKKTGILLLELPGDVALRKVTLVLHRAGFA